MAPDDSDEGEQNIYGNEARENLMENGEISPEEDAFMQGYETSEKEEEDTGNAAYEAAFGSAKKRRRTKSQDLDDEDLENY